MRKSVTYNFHSHDTRADLPSTDFYREETRPHGRDATFEGAATDPVSSPAKASANTAIDLWMTSLSERFVFCSTRYQMMFFSYLYHVLLFVGRCWQHRDLCVRVDHPPYDGPIFIDRTRVDRQDGFVRTAAFL
jgi:hypothetical protein